MRIATRTADLLVLRQSAWVGRAMGLTFALLGAGTIVFFTHVPRASIQGPLFVAYVVGGMFILVGLTLAAMTRNEGVTFDRQAGLVRIVRGQKTTDYPLTQVTGVALESSLAPDMDNPGTVGTQRFYRPILILADGRHIPWTSMSTSDGRGQAACVTAARAFGQWAAVPTDATHVPAPAPVIQVRNGNYAVAYAMLGLFTIAGCLMAGVDALRLATWQPVPATVMGSTVETIRGTKGGVSYRPAVSYWYQRNGTQFVATGVTPLRFGAGWKWAQSIAHRFQSGAQVTAYVDPHDPTRAFLVHQFDMLPAVFLGIVAVMWALVLWGRFGNANPSQASGDLGVPVLERS